MCLLCVSICLFLHVTVCMLLVSLYFRTSRDACGKVLVTACSPDITSLPTSLPAFCIFLFGTHFLKWTFPASWISFQYSSSTDTASAVQNYLAEKGLFFTFFTFTLLLGSSALLQTCECSEYHPSEQSPVIKQSFSYQASAVWNQLHVSVIWPL